ncbi:protein SGT1 homolog isoform X3 [Scomber scombrus]|uniref:protein SGT1 homolog isoform X3 n=1 Tax=Scomber scombrus TaxID=13677 RepID=UPI002DDBF720|nr:protein SGT1 homolog isoform X3 [Scomber scombrus]
MATESRFPDSFIDDDPQKALEALNEALQGDSDNAEWFCQRAYAHILLKNYSFAADDAKKAQHLQPSLPLAFMRTGIAEYHLNHYESAHAAFTQGHQIDGGDEDEEDRCHQMGEAGGRRTGVQHQTLQSNSVPGVVPPQLQMGQGGGGHQRGGEEREAGGRRCAQQALPADLQRRLGRGQASHEQVFHGVRRYGPEHQLERRGQEKSGREPTGRRGVEEVLSTSLSLSLSPPHQSLPPSSLSLSLSLCLTSLFSTFVHAALQSPWPSTSSSSSSSWPLSCVTPLVFSLHLSAGSHGDSMISTPNHTCSLR